ncbi:MAG: RNA polymerase factor sigma-54 [Cyclobacteriaceae bacterium]
MQRLDFKQLQTQRLSPQQIQFIKLLQIPTVALEARIKEEMESNPALDEGPEEETKDEFSDDPLDKEEKGDELNLEEYLQDDYSGYKMQGDGGNKEEEKEMPLASVSTMTDTLKSQVGYLRLNEHETTVVMQLVGSIESDGYIRRELESIVNDLAFAQGIETDLDEVESLLHRVQRFEPPGIGARNLQECLSLQLERKADLDEDRPLHFAKEIVEHHFESFTKKHYRKITERLGITEEELKEAIEVITKLNPKPGSAAGGSGRAQQIIPDFIVTNNDGTLEVSLNARNAPELKVSRSYTEMFDTYQKSEKKDKKMRETVSFVKQKLDSAKWFIDAIKQRQDTLLRTMNTIIQYQYDYFLEGDESELKPMILKDIAERIEMDISTVSRVANSKAVQTEFGIFPLKYFFSESLTTESGEDVSSREVKHILKQIIEGENKRKPLSDEKIEKELKEKGYSIARRTVAKYREQLNIPVARLRKQL